MSLQTIEATSKARACSYKPSKTIHDLTKISDVFDLSSFYFQKLEMHIRILVYAMKTKNCQDFCHFVHILGDFINSFWNLLTFSTYFGIFRLCKSVRLSGFIHFKPFFSPASSLTYHNIWLQNMGTCHLITMSPTWTHEKFHVWITSTQNLLTSTQSLTHFCYCCGQKRRWCLITVIGLFAFAVVWTHLWSTVV